MRAVSTLATGTKKCVAARRTGTLRAPGQTQELAVWAAFFRLLFFAAAKKSRLPPRTGATLANRYENADASAAKKPNHIPKHQKTEPRRQGAPPCHDKIAVCHETGQFTLPRPQAKTVTSGDARAATIPQRRNSRRTSPKRHKNAQGATRLTTFAHCARPAGARHGERYGGSFEMGQHQA